MILSVHAVGWWFFSSVVESFLLILSFFVSLWRNWFVENQHHTACGQWGPRLGDLKTPDLLRIKTIDQNFSTLGWWLSTLVPVTLLIILPREPQWRVKGKSWTLWVCISTALWSLVKPCDALDSCSFFFFVSSLVPYIISNIWFNGAVAAISSSHTVPQQSLTHFLSLRQWIHWDGFCFQLSVWSCYNEYRVKEGTWQICVLPLLLLLLLT